MLSLLSSLGLSRLAPSPRMPTSANIAEIKSAIMLGHIEAVRAKLSEEGLSGEAWHALRADVSTSGSAPAIKGVLQQMLADAALKHAVRANDIDTARQALLSGAEPEGIPVHAVADDKMRALLIYAHRKNKLYPPNGPHGPETALDRALRNGLEERDRQAAMDLLGMAAGNKQIPEAWRDAVKDKQVDVQRALLLLGYADQDRGFRLLQKDAVTDPGVIAVMKEIPYFSPKRGLPRKFNCQAMFPGTNEKIECRHLVEHRHATLEQSERRKFDYVQYATVQNIAAHVSPATYAQYKHLTMHAAETHLFHNHDFGQVLVGQFGEMQRKKETSRLLLLTSSNHVMSVELKVKDKDGKPHYVAALFDPNATTSHIRFASDDLRTLEGLTLKSVIKQESTYKLYYPNSDEISLMFVRPLTQAQAQAEPVRGNRGAGAVENRTLTSCIHDEQLNEIALHHMLENGFSGDIRRLRNEMAKRPEDERLQLLQAKDGDRVPGFYLTLQNGHADAIRAYGEVLKGLQVPSDKCIDLLAAKRVDGVPGLYVALQQGHADTIRAYGEVLKGLRLPPDKCIDLLATKRVDGVPGLFGALHNGHADAIRAFGEALKGLQVSPDKCIDLLEAKRVDSIPGLYVALQNGHADAIRAFGEALKGLQLPLDQCIDLLVAKGVDGVPGLSMALQNGHADAITAFGQVLKELQVPPDKCIDLLASKNHISGLFKAAENGHADAIAAFGQVLKELQIPPDKCVEMLAAKRDDGVSELQWSLKNGKLETVEQYIQIVKKIAPELDKEQRAALLKEIRKSHAKQKIGRWWSNFKHYKELKKNNPDFYRRFKEMKNALKWRTR